MDFALQNFREEVSERVETAADNLCLREQQERTLELIPRNWIRWTQVACKSMNKTLNSFCKKEQVQFRSESFEKL